MAGPSSPEADGALAFERVDKAYGAAAAVRDLTLCVRLGLGAEDATPMD